MSLSLYSQRLKNGCTKSFKSILLMMIAGILFTIGMAIHLKSFHIVTIVLPVLMALGNTYGLVLVSLLLGNGLINIPKTLWRQACPANELRRVRIMAVGAEEELFESVMILEDVEDRIEEVCAMAVTLGDVTNDGSSSHGNRFENEDGTTIRVGTRRQRANRCGAALCFCCCKVDDVTEFHECLEELVRRNRKLLIYVPNVELDEVVVIMEYEDGVIIIILVLLQMIIIMMERTIQAEK